MQEDKNKKLENQQIQATKFALFNQSFKHIMRLKDEKIEPIYDPETGERITYAVIGAVKIK